MERKKGYSAGNELIEWVFKNIPFGSYLLELGSGDGTTKFLSGKYRLYSVEHDPDWIGIYPARYIYAPLKNGWYDSSVLQSSLPNHYSLLIVDGPPDKVDGQRIGRLGLLNNMDLFDLSVHILVDDTNRKKEKLISKILSEITGRKEKRIRCSGKRFFTVI